MPTFEEAVNEIRSLYYENKPVTKRQRTKLLNSSIDIARSPLKLHFYGYTYKDALREIQRIQKAEATIHYDSILMGMPQQKPEIEHPFKREILIRKEKETRKEKGEKGEEQNVLKAVAEAKKRIAEKRRTLDSKRVQVLEDINKLNDLQLIAYARDNLPDMYAKLKSGVVALHEFRKEVRSYIARKSGLDKKTVERYITGDPAPLER